MFYSKTCVRQPPLKLTLVVNVERWLSYKGTCHVILLAKLHDMYLYKTDNFFRINHYLKSVSKVALLHRFYCIPESGFDGVFSSVSLGHNSWGSSLRTSIIATSKDQVSESDSELLHRIIHMYNRYLFPSHDRLQSTRNLCSGDNLRLLYLP